MLLKAIRKHKRAAKIPIIILVVVLSVSLVASFTPWQSPDLSNLAGTGEAGDSVESQLQNLLTNIRLYEQALKTNPDNVNAVVTLANSQYDLGAFYFDLQNYEEGLNTFKSAVTTYQKALELEPENIGVLVDLATAAFYSEQYDLAEEHFQKAILQEPEFLNARLNYGIFLQNIRDDKKGAIEQWQAALDTKPDAQIAATFESLIQNASQ